MPFSLELPMNTPDWTDVGSGVRKLLPVPDCDPASEYRDPPAPAVVFGVPQAEAYLVYVAGIPTLCGVLAGLAETSAERPNRVGRVIGFLPVWGLDVDVECAVIIRGDGMASAQNIRHSG